MNDLNEALENCLQEIEHGADLETVLIRYPELAEELRPILEASGAARSMAVLEPSPDVVRRSRARVLQHAAQLREGRARSSQRLWFASLRRLAVTLAVVATLFASGTGLVGASSNTLPGDNLYPVKRTWEGVRLLFAFNPQERDVLEVEHENERLHELQELLAEGRSAEAGFNGLVTSQNGNVWIVAGVRVIISSQTELRDAGMVVGSAVHVQGLTQDNNTFLAQQISLLSSHAKLPDVEDEHEVEDNSGPGSVNGDDQPQSEETQTPENDNDNSHSGSDPGTNEAQNENLNDNSNQNSNDNGDESNANTNSNDNGDSANDNSNDDSGGGNDQSGGGDQNNNDNGSNSGGDNNSGSGGGGDH
jgi:hypothetical protein